MDTINENKFLKGIVRILKGDAVALIITLILLLIFAVLLTFTSLQENIINPVIIVISGISILIGSSISTLKIKKNGLLNGGLVGLIYILIMYIISGITGSGFSLNISSIIMIIASILSGLIGGIIGVNL